MKMGKEINLIKLWLMSIQSTCSANIFTKQQLIDTYS
jgi:hypothetical protein